MRPWLSVLDSKRLWNHAIKQALVNLRDGIHVSSVARDRRKDASSGRWKGGFASSSKADRTTDLYVFLMNVAADTLNRSRSSKSKIGLGVAVQKSCFLLEAKYLCSWKR